MASSAAHVFSEKTFARPTRCAHCSRMLWGLTKQGLQCRACRTVCHKRCEDQVSLSCSRPPGWSGRRGWGGRRDRRPPRDGDGSVELVPANGRRAGNRAAVAVSPRLEDSPARRKPASPRSSRPFASAAAEPNRGGTDAGGSRIVQELFVSTARKHVEAERLSQAPALNLLTTTPKNLAGFVMRVGPVFSFKHAVEKVVTWEDPIFTMLIMAVWVLACLHPIVLVVLPQVLLLRKILYNYYARARALAVKDHGKPSASSPTRGTDVALYKKNLQHIQNSMGQYVDLYDALNGQYKMLDWSDEQATLAVTKVIVVAIPLTVVLFWVVPLKLVLLFGGLYPFVANTIMARAAVSTLIPYFEGHIRDKLRSVRESIEKHISSGACHEKKQVRLYEAQRWWAGVGFTSRRMLGSDPAPWADESGARALPPKELCVPPPGYAFAADSEWTVDRGFHPDCDGDENGWVYTDLNWNHSRKRTNVFSATRRRCWVRDLVHVGGFAGDSDAPSGDSAALTVYAGCPRHGDLLPTPPASPGVDAEAPPYLREKHNAASG